MPQSRAATTRLVRRFAVTGAAIMLLSAALVAPIHYYIEQRDIKQSVADYNESLANILAFLTRDHVKAILVTADESEHAPILHAIRATLDGAFEHIDPASNLLKVKLFDARGVLIYSTNAEEIGEVGDSDDDGFERAFRDHTQHTDQTYRAKINALRGPLTDRYVVASYVPIFADPDRKQMLGLFELYSDVTERESAFRQALILEMVLIVVIVGIGYAGLLVAIWLGARDMERAHHMNLEMSTKMASLSASAQARTRLLMSMSHHLKTPLNAIIGFSEMIAEERLGALGDKRYAHYAGDILESGRHLLQGIDNILEYVRVDSGKVTINPDMIAPQHLLAAIVRDLAPAAAAAQVSVVVAPLSSELAHIVSDVRFLRQILRNVTDNAIRYNRPGGHVWLDCTIRDAGHVAFTIADDGIGVAEADLADIFEPFGTKAQVLTQVQGGFGLGLSLSRRLAQFLGGTLSLERREAGGVSVTLVLPREIGAAGDGAG
ncbi:sensor histidine kinase [Dongia rigui]|uniref:histidine kinase n=1 Tax=Dongia rigui TaxID=940149 RepID=A0ABU5DY90_9PROT|nr:HAMP domain-containing sensor histidine kinase [Dongia rigui]MDY0871909.1 HAMP domain-containing sensor histidine kinase [Dongia rigui]